MVTLRPYQRAALDAIYEYFEHEQGSPILCLPTGAGKSLLIGGFCDEVIRQWRDQRIVVVTHVQELLTQNMEKIRLFNPRIDAGFYCAALKEKKARAGVVVASIQSAHRKANAIGWRDIMLIDECHLVGTTSETMYRRFIRDLRAINPRLKVIGLTASPYRTRTGSLVEGEDRLFDDIAYEVTMKELLDAGHLAPMIGRPSVVQADLSDVRTTAGEWNQLDACTAMERITWDALNEVFALGGDRRSWLVFCSGVRHAEGVRDEIARRGVSAAVVTGDTPKEERAAILAAFKAGRLRCAVSVGVLTTGFDAPAVDLIVLLRATKSPGLFLQMAGRGLRTAPGKTNCLLLDYGSNLDTHGPVTHIRPPRSARSQGKREAHTPACLICPECRMASPLESQECADCGYEFPERERRVNHEREASRAEVMVLSADASEWMEVSSVRYARYQKEGKLPTLRVTYQCGLRRVNEWVCVEHAAGSYPRRKAEEWWSRRCALPIPDSVGSAVAMSAMLEKPARLRARHKGEFLEIREFAFARPDDRPSPGRSDTPPHAA